MSAAYAERLKERKGMTKDVFDFARRWVRTGKMTAPPLVPKFVADANARQKAAIRVLRAQALRNNVTPASRSYEAKANYAMRQAYHAMTAQIQAVAIMGEKK